MAASVLLTIGHQQELLDLIVKKASSLLPGQEGKTAMGPVIDKETPYQLHRLKFHFQLEGLDIEVF